MKRIIREFDGVSEIVYVADIKDYVLLFLNKAGLKAFGYDSLEQVEGKKCYEVLQGRKSPCPFCTNGKLHKDKYLEWRHKNRPTGKEYRLKDKLISWEGREARIEIAEEIFNSGQQNAEAELKRMLEREQIVMECIQMMHSSLEVDMAVNNTLEVMGRYLYGERTYIFNTYGSYMDNIYEWCAEGVSEERGSLQKLPISAIQRWLPYFYRNECVIIRDVELIKESAPEEYAILKRQGIKTLIAVPFIEKEQLVGYFGIDNPKAGNLDEVSNILKMLAYFFQALLERKKREDYLKKIGFTDTMTGANNKNAFIRDTMLSDTGGLSSAGGFFIDINGLKKTNDTYGHEAGDNLIRQVYQIICYVMGDFPVYRLGGDEFAVLCRNISKEKLEGLHKRLREELDGRNGCNAAIGASFLENPSDLGVLIDEADKRMYKDKKQYYKKIGSKR